MSYENESQLSRELLVYFEGGTSKMYANQLKDVCNGVHFFDKIAG